MCQHHPTNGQAKDSRRSVSGQALVSNINNTKQVNINKQTKGRQAVLDFIIENFFNVDEGKKFFEHYENNDWKTSDGKKKSGIGVPWPQIGWIEPKYSAKKTNQTKNKRPKSRTTCEPLKAKIMDNPSKINEGGVEFSLGDFDGKCVHYDFSKILVYLNVKGKLLFGKRFKIYEEDKEILLKLCSYFIKDLENCQKYEIDIDKGILLSGPVGCGKTSLMKLLHYLVPLQKPYEMIPCRNVAFSFNHLGFKTIEDYGNTKFFCFDDLGLEPAGRFYGKDLNVMGEVLLSRYELYLQTKRNQNPRNY